MNYDIAVTVTGNSQSGVVVTDILPAGETFVTGLSAPGGVAPVVNGQSLSWTLPTLAIGTYDITYQVKVDDFQKGGTILVNNAQMSVPGQGILVSTAPVTVIGSFTVKVGVYNESGELVKEVLVETLSQPINAINLESTNVITSLHGTGSQIGIYYGGYLIGTWDGTNNSGNPVSNGSYHVKVDNVDVNGVVTSVSQGAIVDRKLSTITVKVYNEAGEVVRNLLTQVDDPTGAVMTGVTLSTGVVAPGASGSPNTVQIVVQTSSGAPITLVWDGKSDNGNLVTPGKYELGVHYADGAGGNEDISRGVLLTGGAPNQGAITAGPNMVTASSGSMVTTFRISSVNSYRLRVKLYTIAGELVKDWEGTFSPANQVSVNCSGLATGVYLARVEALDSNNALAAKQVLKILVAR